MANLERRVFVCSNEWTPEEQGEAIHDPAQGNVIIVVLQNTQSVETRILLVTLSMPRAVLLFVTLLLGFVLGLVAASWRGREGGSRTDS
jgi:hypothetical protein